MTKIERGRIVFLIMAILVCGINGQSQENLAPGAAIEVSSLRDAEKYPAANLSDGIVSDASRWLSAAEDTSWIIFSWVDDIRLGGIHLYSGWVMEAPVNDLYIEFHNGTEWQAIPSSEIQGNRRLALEVIFDATVEVSTTALRINITATHQDIARIREITVWAYDPEGLPALGTGVEGYVPEITEDDIPKIYLNQAGFNTGKPKRFTAPTLPDGTAFFVREMISKDTVYSGTLSGQIGDFTDFDPVSGPEYEVVADTLFSFPFRIDQWLLEATTYQGAVDFMIDSRHYVGNYRGTRHQSYGWRDDTHFGWELHTLVPQFLSNPQAYLNMPSQVSYETPSDPSLWGDLEPYDAEAPDIVKLIHWGADVIVTQGLTHENLKAQLAYFLYAWTWMQEWLPQQNYDLALQFAFDNWENSMADRDYSWDESPEHDLLSLKTKMGSTKGELPPGRTVLPNLLMYEVAQREEKPDPEIYFQAAFQQVEWIIENIDWEDSITTKGQRMSEHLTMTGLSFMLKEYPERAPEGLEQKILDWAAVMIRRSENMWDFRKLTDDGAWVPYDETAATKWNEPGNVVGFPACLLSAMEVIEDPQIEKRFNELLWSHMDNCFGRNPVGRHFSYDAAREIEGVELGWYSYYKGGIGMLENTRFVLDGAPKYNHYPYHPEIGNVGWTEGWVQFNVAYNLSLAYMAEYDTEFSFTRSGNDILLELTAPVNFDPTVIESVEVQIKGENGTTSIIMTEASADADCFSARLNDLDSLVSISYGFGYFENSISIEPVVNVKNRLSSSGVEIFPNPVRDILFVKGIEDGEMIGITDMSGRRTELQLWNGQVDLSGLDTGVYFLSLGHSLFEKIVRID